MNSDQLDRQSVPENNVLSARGSLSTRDLHEMHVKVSNEFADLLERASSPEDIKMLQVLHAYLQMISDHLKSGS
jgi:hypothetical protein